MIGVARGVAGWISDAKRMDRLLDSVLRSGVGATPAVCGARTLGCAKYRFIGQKAPVSPDLCTTSAPANPQHVVDELRHGHNLWERRPPTQEDFWVFFFSADSAAWRGFLLKI